MNARSKKCCWVGGLLLGALLVACAWLLFKLTRDIEPQWAQDPNPVEAYEASRKIRLVSNTNSAAKGFVRLSEVEINSYLQEKLAAETNSASTPLVLDQAGILLESTNLTLICWTHQTLFGQQIPFVYQRSYGVLQTNHLPDLRLQKITIGELEIPRFLWTRAEDFFASMNTRLEERRRWVSELPAVQLTNNEITRNPEVRLYNHNPGDL